nr:hypothetical protein [Tanacetum cinerariifolium]
MKVEHYLSHTDYPIWQVIQNGNGLVSITTDTNRMIKVLPPKTAEEIVAREKERKARTTLLMALPEDHLAKFHKMKGLHKGYDRFQTLMSQLEIHGAGVSHEDANRKFLRSQVALIMRNKPGLDTLSFDDLYNNLRMDLKWKVAMISMRINKFHKRKGRKLQFDTMDPVGFDMTKVECFNCHKIGHFARDCRAKGNHDSRRRDVSSPPKIGNYMPFGPDVEIDYSKFTYGPKQSSVDESNSKPSEYASCKSKSGVETTTSMPEPIKSTPKVVCDPKVWTDAPIIKEYESYSDNDSVSNVLEDKEKPSFVFTDSVKHVKTSRENVKETGTPNHSPKLRSRIEMVTLEKDDPHGALKDKGIVDSGCSRHMIGNKAHLKGKQHKASCKEKTVSSMNQPLQILHMDLFGPTSDETTPILKDFIIQVKNQFNQKVKTIRSDNETEFKNNELVEFCGLKGIKRKYSNAITPQQNRVAKRKNRTFIEAARTMLADSFLPTTFWVEVVNTACYVLNRVLVTKPQNKTPYELLTGKCDGKSNSGFLVRYSLNSKAFRVCNLETKRVEESLHVNFLENKPNVAGKGHAWMFDLDYLTNSINYEPVLVENQANKYVRPKEAENSVGTQANDVQGANSEEIDLHEENFVMPIWSAYSTTVKNSGDKIEKNTNFKTCEKPVSQVEQIILEELETLKRQEKEANDATESLRKEATHDIQNANTSSTNLLNTVSTPLSTAGPSRSFNDGELLYLDDPLMPYLEDIYASLSEGIFTDSSYDDEGVVTDFNNLKTTVNVSLTPITRIHNIHPKTQILRDPMLAVQTRSKVNKNSKARALFQIQKLWILVDLTFGKKAIRTKWVYKNKKDERIVVVRNKARLVAQSTFLYGTVDEKVYVSQPPGFVDPKFLNKVYKVVKALYGLHQALRACVKTASAPIETQKPLLKEEEAVDVDVHLYRSMIGSLMYLTASRTDIMFSVCACFRFQALIDEKRVNIKESSIRRTLKLDDTEGTSCLANAKIFNGLAKMGYEKLSEELTFYKAFFSPQWKFLIHNILHLVKNIEARVPFLRFPRFVQLLINHQLGDMSHHKDIYDTPSVTKKVFNNMKMVGAGFFRVVIALFDNMLVPAAKEVVLELESEVIDTKSSFKERIEKLEGRVSKLKEENTVLKELHNVHSKADTAAPIVDKEKSFKQGRIIAKIDEDIEINLEEAQAKLYKIDLEHPQKVLITTAGATTTTKAPKVSVPRRRRGVILQDPEETTSLVVMHSKVQPKDKGKEATPLASKIPIVNYKIHFETNKPYFKIIRADEPKNYSDDYLLKTLKIMFKQLDVEASVSKDQKGRYRLAKADNDPFQWTHTSFKDFLVYQMDVKSDFLYGKIKEEVYVYQPPGFEDPDFPDKVYKVEKALYRLHQVLRAWHKDDILLIQVYVDDIIFCSTKKELCNEFEKMMHDKFQMSSIGELTFFLGLQVKQKQNEIFISQDKYVAEILKKYGFSKVKNASTSMETQKPLLKDEDGKEVDVHMYKSKIGSLMYLISSRPDIIYLKGQPKFSLWYLKDSPFDLIAYTDSDYAGASLDRRLQQEAIVKAKTVNGEGQLQALVDGKKILITESTIRRDLQWEDNEGVDCLPNDAQEDMGEGSTNPTDPYHTPIIIQPSTSQPQKTKPHRKPRRKFTEVPQPSDPISLTDETVNEEMDVSLERAATSATSLAAKQDIGVSIPRSGEDSLKLFELMELCTKLQQRVLDLETTKTTQDLEIDNLKRRVKRLKRRKRSRTHRLKRLYKVRLSARVKSSRDQGFGEEDASKQGRIADIEANEDITFVNTHDEQMFDADQDLVYPLSERLQAEDQQELNDKEKAKLFMPLMKKRRKFFAAKRVEEKRNKPPTQAQQRKIMINTFVDVRTELVEESSKKDEVEVIKGSSKRAGTELEQEISKKQKIDDDKEIVELQQLFKIIPNEEGVAIDAIPLAVKPPSIKDVVDRRSDSWCMNWCLICRCRCYKNVQWSALVKLSSGLPSWRFAIMAVCLHGSLPSWWFTFMAVCFGMAVCLGMAVWLTAVWLTAIWLTAV